MKKIFAIFRKDTLLRFTSPVEWGFFLILPIIFTFILGSGTGNSQDQRIEPSARLRARQCHQRRFPFRRGSEQLLGIRPDRNGR